MHRDSLLSRTSGQCADSWGGVLRKSKGCDHKRRCWLFKPSGPGQPCPHCQRSWGSCPRREPRKSGGPSYACWGSADGSFREGAMGPHQHVEEEGRETLPQATGHCLWCRIQSGLPEGVLGQARPDHGGAPAWWGAWGHHKVVEISICPICTKQAAMPPTPLHLDAETNGRG